MSDNTTRPETSGGDVLRSIDTTSSKIQAVDLLVARAGVESGVASRVSPLTARDASLWADVSAAFDRREAAMSALVERRLRRRRAGAALPGAVYAGGNPPVAFDPATLSLTGWWRGPYAGTPWTSTASAGVSGGRNIAEATDPPAIGTGVRGLNGIDVADFDGTLQRLRDQVLTLDDYANAASVSVWCLFFTDAIGVVADPGAGLRYQAPQFISDGSTSLALGFTAAGVHLTVDGSVTERVVACTSGAWHLAQGKLSGGTLSLRVDSGARSSVASGNVADLTNLMRFGVRYSGTVSFFDGLIAEIGITDVALSDAQEDGVKSYINTRYGLAL